MRKTLAVLTILLLPSLAQATYQCTGTVTDLAISPGTGTVAATVGTLSWVYLCQIGATYNGVSSDVCKAIYSHLLSAKSTGKQEMFWFNDTLTCTTHPAWANLTGWYFGPDFQ